MSELLSILQGDCRDALKTLPDASVQCCVTSPPYWGLRDYGVAGQIGLEKTPEEYVSKMVSVFAEVRRVLMGDGTLWLNLGDIYVASPTGNFGTKSKLNGIEGNSYRKRISLGHESRMGTVGSGLPAKNLIGIPWRVAFALQTDGWYLRSDIIWAKPNPMPESVTDRPTKSHEYLLLLAKSQRYYYDAEAIKEKSVVGDCGSSFTNGKTGQKNLTPVGQGERVDDGFRNKRDVWTVPTSPYSEAHFATFPPDLIKPCILAGTKPGDVVLDPFGGSGTTGQVALELGRKAILIELNPEYVKLIEKRTNVTPGLQLA